MQRFKILLPLITLFLLLGCATEVGKVKLYEAPKPDEKLLSLISSVMREDYIENLEWKEGCVLEVDTNGIIETNWHQVKQDQATRKIQIYVWGDIYRVDVWHKYVLSPFRGTKDYASRLVEMQLQQSIEKKLAEN